nr:hypothetical protein [Tanacetum cinerariifolium]
MVMALALVHKDTFDDDLCIGWRRRAATPEDGLYFCNGRDFDFGGKGDDERTESNNDKSIDINRINDAEETQKDEFVHTLDDYVPTDDETHDIYDEEYVRINEELYGDVNVEMKDVETTDEGKGNKLINDVS